MAASCSIRSTALEQRVHEICTLELCSYKGILDFLEGALMLKYIATRLVEVNLGFLTWISVELSHKVKPTLLLKLYKHERLYHVQYGHCAALMSQPIHPSSNHKKICAQIHDICTSFKVFILP